MSLAAQISPRLTAFCILCVQVKSYLTGNPAIAIALNDSLVIGRREASGSVDYGGYGRGGDTVMLDDCNFHQSVSLDRFETERTLQLVPPDGEFCGHELPVHLPLQAALPGQHHC